MVVLTPSIKCKANKFWIFIGDELTNGCSPLLVYLRIGMQKKFINNSKNLCQQTSVVKVGAEGECRVQSAHHH